MSGMPYDLVPTRDGVGLAPPLRAKYRDENTTPSLRRVPFGVAWLLDLLSAMGVR